MVLVIWWTVYALGMWIILYYIISVWSVWITESSTSSCPALVSMPSHHGCSADDTFWTVLLGNHITSSFCSGWLGAWLGRLPPNPRLLLLWGCGFEPLAEPCRMTSVTLCSPCVRVTSKKNYVLEAWSVSFFSFCIWCNQFHWLSWKLIVATYTTQMECFSNAPGVASWL